MNNGYNAETLGARECPATKTNTDAETQGVNSRNRYDKFTTGSLPIAERQPRTKQRSAGSEVPSRDFESGKVRLDSKSYK